MFISWFNKLHDIFELSKMLHFVTIVVFFTKGVVLLHIVVLLSIISKIFYSNPWKSWWKITFY